MKMHKKTPPLGHSSNLQASQNLQILIKKDQDLRFKFKCVKKVKTGKIIQFQISVIIIQKLINNLKKKSHQTKENQMNKSNLIKITNQSK